MDTQVELYKFEEDCVVHAGYVRRTRKSFWGREYDACDGVAQIRRDDGVDVLMACKTLADLGA